MKTSNMKLMDMVTTFNNKCKEKDVGEWIICHQAELQMFGDKIPQVYKKESR